MEAIIEGELPAPPFARLIGDGEAVFRCSPDESMYNPLGLVHGGVLCALLDSAAGCAVQTLLPAGTGCSSIEIKVSFLQPVLVGTGELEVRGRVLRVGGRVAFAEAHARDRQGRLLGHATTSLSVVRP